MPCRRTFSLTPKQACTRTIFTHPTCTRNYPHTHTEQRHTRSPPPTADSCSNTQGCVGAGRGADAWRDGVCESAGSGGCGHACAHLQLRRLTSYVIHEDLELPRVIPILVCILLEVIVVSLVLVFILSLISTFIISLISTFILSLISTFLLSLISTFIISLISTFIVSVVGSSVFLTCSAKLIQTKH